MSAPGTSPGWDAAASHPGGAPAVPHRADGVELIGEMRGSGYRRPPALVRRGDGQVIQLTPLLYNILSAVDGEADHERIAAVVSERVQRRVGASDVRALIESKLRPMGVLQGEDGSQPTPRKATPLLGLKMRCVVSRPEVTRRITAPFAPLFHPGVVVAVVAAFVAVSFWVLFEKGLGSAAYEAFRQPSLLLLVFAVTVISAGFHEFGHAAAARYGGATPGAMGFGLYLLWPAFYTDVTDSYRLGRAGRLRTDLGGLYFNAIVAVGIFGVWWLSGWDSLLLVVATQLLQMVRQLAPMVRFDGYHVLADLTGVPDLFHRIKPTLLGLLPHRWRSPETTVLKPWARAVVTLWVVVVVPLLLLSMVLALVTLPRIVGTAWSGLRHQWHGLTLGYGDGDFATVLVKALGILAIAVPLAGTLYLLLRMARRSLAKLRRGTRGKPVRRALAGLLVVAVAAAVAWAWWPDARRYRPIQPGERGTIQDVLPLAGATPAGFRGTSPGDRTAAPRQVARTVWPRQSALPTRDKPELAVVLTPKAGPGAQPQAEGDAAGPPTWVFPFDPPHAPGPGDNQVLVWNTTDGSVQYEVSFALVWVTDGEADNRNEAYALANCRDCASVAIAFQVVLVVGHADVVPQNVAVAVNHTCSQCLTFALASQLVVTLPDVPSEQVKAELARIWADMAELANRMRGMSAQQIEAELEQVKARILDVVRPAGGSTPPGTGTTTTGVPSAPGSSSAGVPSPTGSLPTVPSITPTGTSAPGGSSGTPSEQAPPGSSTAASTPGSTTPSPSDSGSESAEPPGTTTSG
ncbi:hypothetical protein V5P93_005186 [Actinokineospora auranticolor]|uniref:Putative peptide zinc metalloprotease protein n=1 Tax=Actinokineospora auranticolor TaxID=155976 RepID=A0A2S6GC74_9PSEU|nr:M50 family metallopeptidase [Actinokineospora auranticolor]PPK62054.1 putative peptide zinc metalloprotease protein [Actinokineospora auranticolor]